MKRVPIGVMAAVLSAVVVLVAPPAVADKAGTRGLRFPSLSPDGKTVVFAFRGDIWRAPTAGGTAVRLTIHEAQDTRPRVSPDGQWIAFTSKRTGNYDVFVMPLEGGEPRQVTFHSGADVASDWSPDGKKILFLSNRDPTGHNPHPDGTDLYEVDVAGGTPRRITTDGGREGTYASDGKSVVYSRGVNTPFQDEYKGSANYDLFVVDLAGGLPRRLTKTDSNEWSPAFCTDCSAVYYLAEKDHKLNFFSIPATGGEPKALTSWTDENARRPSLSADHHTMAFEKDGRIFKIDLAAEKPEAVAIPVTVESDVRNSGIDVRTITAGGEHGSVSPDGSQLAFMLRGDIWILPASGGEGVRVTSGPSDDDWPRFSPDGRRLSYSSNPKGNRDLFVMDLATKETKQVTANAKDDDFQAWSPDGKRLVFSSDRTGNKDLFTVEIETGEERQLTHDPAPDDDPVFSADGKWIAFDSGRGGTQAIYIMPSGPGGEAQARRVTSGTSFFQVPSFSPDGSMIAFEEFDQTGDSPGGIFAVRSSGGPSMQLSKDGTGAFWSPRGDWIYFGATRGGEAGVYRLHPPAAIEAGERVPFMGRIEVDRRREFGDLFDEAWSKLKDGFYDAKMHGVDWDAMKKKYRPLAVDAEVKDEFYNVVSQMLGELNASHLGIYGQGDDGGGASSAPTGYLGMELGDETADGNGRKVAYVEPKGPADEAGVRVSDVIRSINGRAVKADMNLDQALAGTAGHEVQVTYAKGDGSGEKTLPWKALGADQLAGLKYKRWIEASKKAVEEKTKGDAGYIHLTDMDQPNLARFNAALVEMNKANKKGLVLDVRNNGGGNIHQQLIDALAKVPFIAFQPRGTDRQQQPALSWGKPVVLLINEHSFSDAEVFPYSFKQMKLGKVVGVPTAGGVIGTNDITLSDGSKFRIPHVGWFGLNGEDLEHLGVKPDVLVEETAEDHAAHRDPQLEKAIEILISEMPPHPAAATPPEKKATGVPFPDTTPEEQPGANPTGGPKEGAPGSAAPEVENPLYDAKVGEWVKMRVVRPAGEQVVTTRVTEVSDDEVSLEAVSEGSPPQPVKMPRTKDFAPKGGSAAAEGKETLTVNGVALNCSIVLVKNPDGSTEKRWMTNDIPVRGTVKVERDGKVVSELLEWGTAAK